MHASFERNESFKNFTRAQPVSFPLNHEGPFSVDPALRVGPYALPGVRQLTGVFDEVSRRSRVEPASLDLDR